MQVSEKIDRLRLPQLPTSEEAERWRLYEGGLSDAEIARSQGVTQKAVTRWRQRRGLAVMHDRRLRLQISAQDEAERRSLYDSGLSDAEIARRLGVGQVRVTKWRQRRGLAPNVPSRRMDEEQNAARMLLYLLGMNDNRIAREQRVHNNAVRKWRETRSLPGNPKQSLAQRKRSISHMILDRVRRAIGRQLPADIADDAAGDLCLAVLSGKIALDAIEDAARGFGNRTLSAFANKWGDRSLNEDIGEEPGFTMLDTLRDERSSSWLEEMGATAW
jgi:transcriptional regulator with XRE-family HTH domain